ncbi:MAG: enoyl-CoA hydratase/isomerase family protein, partial [Promethearchaeota archaeon]
MTNNAVVIEKNEDNTIATLKLNRLEKRNAINYDILVGLKDALDKLERTKVRVIIITGGDEFFSSGIDLNFLTGGGEGPEDLKPDINIPRN